MNATAWKDVEAAVAVSKNKTIKELFAADPDRAKRYTVEAAGWTLDYSKNRLDATTLMALLKLPSKVLAQQSQALNKATLL